MQASMQGGQSVDWQAGFQYQALRHLERAEWSWEWLRRHPGYIANASWRASRQIVRDMPPFHLFTLEDNAPEASPWGLRFRRQSAIAGLRGPRVLVQRLSSHGSRGGSASRHGH
ncbi:transcriptional regulator domain-containing protein [Phyllobacterium phragmitis]|uniref:transcriptional regulator domain-containing protein n=1 Tax=Phyllobacterium phragmitis TaxID=2670329 RepID=UPI001304D810|nr:hypothetical protein [Phyllobacterium phragmitis]